MQAVEHYIEKFVPEHYDLFLDLSRETGNRTRQSRQTGADYRQDEFPHRAERN